MLKFDEWLVIPRKDFKIVSFDTQSDKPREIKSLNAKTTFLDENIFIKQHQSSTKIKMNLQKIIKFNKNVNLKKYETYKVCVMQIRNMLLIINCMCNFFIKFQFEKLKFTLWI